MTKHREMTEGEVEHALRLFAGRQLCDRCDIEPADAMAYVLDHEMDIVEAMGEAIYAYHEANPSHDEVGEEGADE
jgi:hypothetical protein